MKISRIDKTIIKILVKDARESILSTARKAGISVAAISQMLRLLEKYKLIAGYSETHNPKSLRFYATTFARVYLEVSNQISSIIKRLKEIPEIIKSLYAKSNCAILIKILLKYNEDLIRVLNDCILSLENILRIETFVSLEQRIKI